MLKFVACLMVLCVAQFSSAQESSREASPSIATMLDDASYSFNRYEELVRSVTCSSYTNAAFASALSQTCKEQIRLIGQNVNLAKAVLSRARRATSPSTADLFDVYVELEEVSSYLEGVSNELANFTTESNQAVQFTQTASKTAILAAHLANAIRVRLARNDCSSAR